MKRVLMVATLLAAIGVAGCTTQSQVLLPPPGSVASNHLYVSDNLSHVFIFTLPITALSTPIGTITGLADPSGLCEDGRLFVTIFTTNLVNVYTAPITSSSTPAFTLSPGTHPQACVVDASGILYVADDNSSGPIAAFTAPVQSGSTVARNITASVSFPFGVGADASGNVFSANSNNVTEYSNFAAGNSLTATFGAGLVNNYEAHVGPDGFLYIANGQNNGRLDVYKPPFSNSSTVDHQISPPSATQLFYIAFDSSNNMYVSGDTATGSHIWEFAPPYTGAPIVTLVTNVTTGKAYGLAIGP